MAYLRYIALQLQTFQKEPLFPCKCQCKATPLDSTLTSVSMLLTMVKLFQQMRLGRGMLDPYNLNHTKC